LTIVAQGSAITESEAADLFDQFRMLLNKTLQSSGKNVILHHGDARIGNGSVDQNAPRRGTSPRMTDEPFTWTKNTHKIRQEIALLAKVSEETVHETTSIFELGLDSIDVIKLSSRLKKRGIELPVSSQTIAKMSLNISAKENRPTDSDAKSLDAMSRDLTSYLKQTGKLPRDIETVLPATPLQQSMVNEMIKSGYKRYFNVDGFKLTDSVDPEKLIDAVKRVIEQSPILRTAFVEIDDPKLSVSYAQIAHKKLDLSTGNLSIRTLEEGQSFQEFINHFKVEAVALAAKSQVLLQAHCVSAGKSKYLVIAISHALYDGTSLRSIHDDIRRAYRGELKPRPSFLTFLDNVFQSTTKDAKKFWRTTLSNLPSATFPRKELSETEPGSLSTRLKKRSRVPLQKIEELCKASRITLQTLGQTCWALVLSHLIGRLDVVFGSVLSCRESEEASEVMFPLMNTVAVRSVIHGSLIYMLKYMQGMSDTTRQYQHFPLGTAQAYALASRQDQASTKNTTLFDTIFIYQGRRSTAGSDRLYESVYGASDIEFPVCAEMEIVDDEYMSWTTACKPISWNTAETEGIIGALETVLERIVANPEAQTIITGDEGISVCGLPKFKISATQPKQAPTQLTNGIDDGWSTTELTIRKALREISDVPEDAIRKDFTIFHLGLDSILVLKLPALLKTYGIKLSVSDILREQTVYAMARAATSSKPDVNGTVDVDSILASAVPAEKVSSELAKREKEGGELKYVMPVTSGELYMIRQWQNSRGAMFYQTFTYSLPGPINKPNLEAAWEELLRQHDILRTGFLEFGADIVQVVFKKPANEVIYNPRDSNSIRQKHRKDLRLPPLNLLVEQPEGPSTILKIVLHHALYDGISLPILVEEFQSLYQRYALAESTHCFRKFIAHSISASSPDSIKEKWKAYLNGPTLYPAYNGKGASETTSKKRAEVFHPLNQISNIKQLAQDSGVSIDALFLAAVSKIYAHRLSSESLDLVVFGIYLANRAPFGEDLSNLAAPTLNILPLRVRDPLSRSIPELAGEIQKDIHMISSKEMVSASLADIYTWTGVRVNFFANILKSANPGMRVIQESEKEKWIAVQDFGKRAEIVDEAINEEIDVPSDGRCDAYLVRFLF
jgi:aryl carrier-like protein